MCVCTRVYLYIVGFPVMKDQFHFIREICRKVSIVVSIFRTKVTDWERVTSNTVVLSIFFANTSHLLRTTHKSGAWIWTISFDPCKNFLKGIVNSVSEGRFRDSEKLSHIWHKPKLFPSYIPLCPLRHEKGRLLRKALVMQLSSIVLEIIFICSYGISFH